MWHRESVLEQREHKERCVYLTLEYLPHSIVVIIIMSVDDIWENIVFYLAFVKHMHRNTQSWTDLTIHDLPKHTEKELFKMIILLL